MNTKFYCQLLLLSMSCSMCMPGRRSIPAEARKHESGISPNLQFLWVSKSINPDFGINEWFVHYNYVGGISQARSSGHYPILEACREVRDQMIQTLERNRHACADAEYRGHLQWQLGLDYTPQPQQVQSAIKEIQQLIGRACNLVETAFSKGTISVTLSVDDYVRDPWGKAGSHFRAKAHLAEALRMWDLAAGINRELCIEARNKLYLRVFKYHSGGVGYLGRKGLANLCIDLERAMGGNILWDLSSVAGTPLWEGYRTTISAENEERFRSGLILPDGSYTHNDPQAFMWLMRFRNPISIANDAEEGVADGIRRAMIDLMDNCRKMDPATHHQLLQNLSQAIDILSSRFPAASSSSRFPAASSSSRFPAASSSSGNPVADHIEPQLPDPADSHPQVDDTNDIQDPLMEGKIQDPLIESDLEWFLGLIKSESCVYSAYVEALKDKLDNAEEFMEEEGVISEACRQIHDRMQRRLNFIEEAGIDRLQHKMRATQQQAEAAIGNLRALISRVHGLTCDAFNNGGIWLSIDADKCIQYPAREEARRLIENGNLERALRTHGFMDKMYKQLCIIYHDNLYLSVIKYCNGWIEYYGLKGLNVLCLKLTLAMGGNILTELSSIAGTPLWEGYDVRIAPEDVEKLRSGLILPDGSYTHNNPEAFMWLARFRNLIWMVNNAEPCIAHPLREAMSNALRNCNARSTLKLSNRLTKAIEILDQRFPSASASSMPCAEVAATEADASEGKKIRTKETPPEIRHAEMELSLLQRRDIEEWMCFPEDRRDKNLDAKIDLATTHLRNLTRPWQ